MLKWPVDQLYLSILQRNSAFQDNGLLTISAGDLVLNDKRI